jgi:hypothetical protein
MPAEVLPSPAGGSSRRRIGGRRCAVSKSNATSSWHLLRFWTAWRGWLDDVTIACRRHRHDLRIRWRRRRGRDVLRHVRRIVRWYRSIVPDYFSLHYCLLLLRHSQAFPSSRGRKADDRAGIRAVARVCDNNIKALGAAHDYLIGIEITLIRNADHDAAATAERDSE